MLTKWRNNRVINRLIVRALLGAWAAATLGLGYLVATEAPIFRLYPTCADWDSRIGELEQELDPFFENAMIAGMGVRRRPDHKGVRVPFSLWWSAVFDPYGWKKAISSSVNSVKRKWPETWPSACGVVDLYALRDADRDWVQSFPWARARPPEEVPGWVDGRTGVNFKALKFHARE